MNLKPTPLQAALLLGCCLSATYASAGYRQLGAHVHGIAHLDLLLDGNTLTLDLDSPAVNLLGFEHTPNSDSEHKVLKRVTTQLHDTTALFSLPKVAGCRAVKAVVNSPLLDATAQGQEKHADMTASYLFTCSTPVELDAITVNLFRLYPGIHKLEVQQITPKGQQAAELTADSPRLQL